MEDWTTGRLEDLGEEVLEDMLLHQLIPHQTRAQEGVGVHQGEGTVVDVVGPEKGAPQLLDVLNNWLEHVPELLLLPLFDLQQLCIRAQQQPQLH